MWFLAKYIPPKNETETPRTAFRSFLYRHIRATEAAVKARRAVLRPGWDESIQGKIALLLFAQSIYNLCYIMQSAYIRNHRE